MIMENEEMSFRATKDIDLVLIVEALTADFGRKFWEFVKMPVMNIAITVRGKCSSIGLPCPKARIILI